MTDENANMRETLSAIRLELDKRRLPMKVCAAKAGVSYSTFLSWFPADGTPQIPSLACIGSLARALPADLFSLLVPDGFHVVPDPEGHDYEEIAKGFADFLSLKNDFHRQESECGPALGPTEQMRLSAEIVRLPLKGKVG